jgi:peptide/nickel transport system substrate-binding protein
MLAVGVALAASALVAAGCASTSSTATGTTPVTGGTATWAELPSDTPNYIFPFESSAYISVSNDDEFAMLMYRPLYWFGTGLQPTLNTSLSLANPPVVNGTKVTITLKHYLWSNGKPVTAQDVMFWLNMESAVGDVDYGAYTGFPNTVVSNLKAVSPTELTMTMDKAYNPNWLLYNDLSQVTPMPPAWDRTASGPSNCDTTVSDCAAVYNYLNDESKDMTSYVGSPLWSIVDGPWKLSAFNEDGHVTFVPNKSYSGPVKPKLAAFEEVPFTTDSAEYDVLRAPSTSTKIDVGYIPPQNVPPKPANAATGPNPVAGYTISPLYTWGISYYTMNQQDTISDHAAIIKQVYFRQAMAYLMNQAAVISGPLRGYGIPTVGPVANYPASKWLSPTGRKGAPFPYRPGKAKSLLTSHGWSVVANGTTTCVNPSLCGPGITKGSPLSFTFTYATGTAWIASEASELQSNAAALGIKLSLVSKPFNDVVAASAGNCVVAKIPCNWDMADWGLGWSFAPDYLPTGETLFMSGAVANSGGYSNPTNDSLIKQTLTSGNLQLFYNWQDYLAPQLPVEYQPNGAFVISEIVNNLKGVVPQNPTLTLNPENWYYVK